MERQQIDAYFLQLQNSEEFKSSLENFNNTLIEVEGLENQIESLQSLHEIELEIQNIEAEISQHKSSNQTLNSSLDEER